MDKSKIITPEGVRQPSKPQEPKPPKQKPEAVSITSITSSPMVTPMGQPAIAVFGLGDNSEVYIWSQQTRKWVES